MSSLATNPNMTPSEVLSLNLNDSALDLLNAAIASHHQVNSDKQLQHKDSSDSNITENEANSTSSVTNHAKRELDKDDKVTAAAPKRAGRKPLDKSQIPDSTLDPKQKRKAQNRAAQRAFRDRKEKHVAELQARIDELEAQNSVKDEDLIAENKKLKEMLQKLQEENYALKGAQFTFEFPVHDNNTGTTNTTIASTSPKSDMNNNNSALYNTSGSSSMSSGNSYSGNEDMSSPTANSPLSNSHTQEDDSTSADTPTTTSNLFSSEPMQFGLIQDQPHQNSLDFLAITDVTQFGLGNGLTTSHNFPTSTNETNFSNIDLFNGKDDLFTNYRVPNTTTTTTTTTTNDEFLFANEDLSNLFGNNDLFGFNNNQFAFNNAQFGLPEVTKKEKKQMMLDKLMKSQQEGRSFQELSQDLQNNCPDFNLDLLCDEMKRKATCTEHKYQITDYDINTFVKCLDRY